MPSRKPSHERYDAFLSFADPDRELAKAISAWLTKDLGLKVFFSKEELPRRGTDWMREIREAIRGAKCFIPLLTRHSARRSWVLYETGMAAVLELPFCIARTANIEMGDLKSIPGPDQTIYDLFDEVSLANFGAKVRENAEGRSGNVSKLLQEAIPHNQHAQKIIKLSRKRSVFIAGSLPNDYGREASLVTGGAGEDPKDLIIHLIQALSSELLKRNFFMTSCPEIETVGFSVLRCVHDWSKQHDTAVSEHFKIGGDYQMDVMPDKLPDGEEEFKQLLRKMARESRKSYLRGQEWLLIIGGKDRTRIEADAATELGDIKICALPFFGGVGLEIWRRQPASQRIDLKPMETWNPELVQKIAMHLSGSW